MEALHWTHFFIKEPQPKNQKHWLSMWNKESWKYSKLVCWYMFFNSPKLFSLFISLTYFLINTWKYLSFIHQSRFNLAYVFSSILLPLNLYFFINSNSTEPMIFHKSRFHWIYICSWIPLPLNLWFFHQFHFHCIYDFFTDHSFFESKSVFKSFSTMHWLTFTSAHVTTRFEQDRSLLIGTNNTLFNLKQ